MSNLRSGVGRDCFTKSAIHTCYTAVQNSTHSRHCRRHPANRHCYRSNVLNSTAAEVASTSGRDSDQKSDLQSSETFKPAGPNGALDRSDHGKFVQFFRMASPYIEGHRGRTFVIVIPGEVHLLYLDAAKVWVFWGILSIHCLVHSSEAV